jgi:hypothetical protein
MGNASHLLVNDDRSDNCIISAMCNQYRLNRGKLGVGQQAAVRREVSHETRTRFPTFPFQIALRESPSRERDTTGQTGTASPCHSLQVSARHFFDAQRPG